MRHELSGNVGQGDTRPAGRTAIKSFLENQEGVDQGSADRFKKDLATDQSRGQDVVGRYITLRGANGVACRQAIKSVVLEIGVPVAEVKWKEGGKTFRKTFDVDPELYANIASTEAEIRAEQESRMGEIERQMIDQTRATAANATQTGGGNPQTEVTEPQGAEAQQRKESLENLEAETEILASLGRKHTRLMGQLDPIIKSEPANEAARIQAIETYFAHAANLVGDLYADADIDSTLDLYRQAENALVTRLEMMKKKCSTRGIDLIHRVERAIRELNAARLLVDEAYDQFYE